MPITTDPKKLMHRFSWLEGQRQNYEQTMQEITDLFMRYRGDITTRSAPGERRKPLFDSFGVAQSDRFVNWLNGTLYPSSSDWVRYRIKGQLEHDVETEEALYATSMRVHDALADSNFYVAAQTDTRDWGVLGNSTLFTSHDEERASGLNDFGGLLFDPVPFSRVWWVFSHIGRPLMVVRELERPAIDHVSFFQRPGDTIPPHLSKLAREQPFTMVKVLHFVQRNTMGKKGGEIKPWASHWIYKEHPAQIRAGQFTNNPYICSRMMVLDGEQYGRGRGHIARPVMKGANEIGRQKFIALGKEMNPPFMAEEDEIASLDLTPGGHVVVRPPKEVQPGYLRSGTDFGLIELVTDNMHKVVSDAFLGDVLGEPEAQTRSAEAERSRQARALARLASTSQTIVHEKLSPLVENITDIMLSKGALPELQGLINENPEAELDFEFTSPFFTAMKAQSLARVDAFLERRFQRFERTGDPEALVDIDNDKLREMEKWLGDVPPIFKDAERIEQERQARGDQAADDRVAQLLERAGQAQTQVQLRPGGSRRNGAGLADLTGPVV